MPQALRERTEKGGPSPGGSGSWRERPVVQWGARSHRHCREERGRRTERCAACELTSDQRSIRAVGGGAGSGSQGDCRSRGSACQGERQGRHHPEPAELRAVGGGGREGPGVGGSAPRCPGVGPSARTSPPAWAPAERGGEGKGPGTRAEGLAGGRGVSGSAGTGRSRAIGTWGGWLAGQSSGRCRWSRGEAGSWRGIWLSCWTCTARRKVGGRSAGHGPRQAESGAPLG